MKKLIYLEDALNVAMQYCPDDDGSCSKVGADIREMLDELESLPSAEPDRGCVEQIKWERDTAIQQLKELGYGFCEKIRTDTDTISRRAVIDVLMTILDKPNHAEFLYTDEICKALNELPSAFPCPEGFDPVHPTDQDKKDILEAMEWVKGKITEDAPSTEHVIKERPLTEDDYAYCAECDHVEMCRWYPMYGCEFKSRPSAEPEKVCIANITLSEDQLREAVEKAKEELKNSAILIEPERKKGEWYKSTGMMPPEYAGVYRCSECDEIAMRDWKTHKQMLTDFCPNCGSYNGGEDEETDIS